MKLIAVSEAVLKRDGSMIFEPKLDARGRIVLTSGEAKYADKLDERDEPVMEELTYAKLFVHALDKADDKISPEERRKRDTLACRIEQALQDRKPVEMSPDDCKRLEAAADLITSNHLFLGRIYDAVENAEKVKEKI